MGVRSCAAWCRAVLSVLLVELAVFEQAEAHKADGVMIWAHSASAVGTLHATLRKTITYSRPVHLCEGDRYGGFQRGLTRVKLLRCAAQAADKNAILLVHIKPNFLVHSITPKSDITDPTQLMKLASQAGLKFVVTVYRENTLAALISSFNRNAKNNFEYRGDVRWRKRLNATFGAGLVDRINTEEKRFYAGTKAARATKKVVLSYKFKDIAFNLCKVTQGVIRKMQTYSKPAVLPKLEVNHLPHDVTTFKQKTLEGALGVAMADIVDEQLSFTDHEWMLDINRDKPPSKKKEVPEPPAAPPQPSPLADPWDRGTARLAPAGYA